MKHALRTKKYRFILYTDVRKGEITLRVRGDETGLPRISNIDRKTSHILFQILKFFSLYNLIGTAMNEIAFERICNWFLT